MPTALLSKFAAMFSTLCPKICRRKKNGKAVVLTAFMTAFLLTGSASAHAHVHASVEAETDSRTAPTITTGTTHQATPQTAADNQAQTILKQAVSWVNAYKSLSFNFNYAVSQSGGKPKLGNGRFLLKGTSYRMQIDQTIFMCDGKNLTIYRPDVAEAEYQDYDPQKDELNPFLWLSNYEKRFRAKYIRLQTQNGRMEEVVDLSPKLAAPFKKIRLFVEHDSHRILGIELYDSQDRTYTYRLTDFVYNPSVKADDFTFNPALYPNVEINDMRD